MLYLIRTFGRGKNKTALKIGYTNNITERFNNYKIHNPFFEIISTRAGTEIDETMIHLYLEALGYKETFLNEWFIDCPEVLSLFHSSTHKIMKTIWNNRNNLFIPSDFKSSGNYKKVIWDIISEKLNKDINPSKVSIDNEWLKIKNLSLIRELKKERKEAEKRYK